MFIKKLKIIIHKRKAWWVLLFGLWAFVLGMVKASDGATYNPSDDEIIDIVNEPAIRPEIKINNVTIAPEPVVNATAVLHMEVVATIDNPDVSLNISLPKGIQLVAGDLNWHGSLVADHPQVHELMVSVQGEGVWRVVLATSMSTSDAINIGDSEYLYIDSTNTSVQILSSSKYYAKYREAWPGYESHLPTLTTDPEFPQFLPGMSGTITIQGNLSYDALEGDCLNPSTCFSSINNGLGRVLVELWDRDPDFTVHYLSTVQANDYGFYSVTVPNEDPDGYTEPQKLDHKLRWMRVQSQ